MVATCTWFHRQTMSHLRLGWASWIMLCKASTAPFSRTDKQVPVSTHIIVLDRTCTILAWSNHNACLALVGRPGCLVVVVVVGEGGVRGCLSSVPFAVVTILRISQTTFLRPTAHFCRQIVLRDGVRSKQRHSPAILRQAVHAH